MAKYQSKQFTGQKPVTLPEDAGPRWTTIDIEFPTTAFASGDLLQLAELPIGIRCLDWSVVFPDIDTGTPALAWSLGVENAGGTDLDTEVWATGLTAGQSTTIARNTTSLAAQGAITAVRRISLKCTTIAATYAGATKVGQVLLLLQA